MPEWGCVVCGKPGQIKAAGGRRACREHAYAIAGHPPYWLKLERPDPPRTPISFDEADRVLEDALDALEQAGCLTDDLMNRIADQYAWLDNEAAWQKLDQRTRQEQKQEQM